MLLLFIAQLIYNTNINVIINQTSFFTNYKCNANLFLKLKNVMILAENAKITAKEMQMLHQKLKQDIKFLLYCLTFNHNQYHAEALILKKRNKVYLLQKNIKMTRSSNKLNHVKIRPFKIFRNIKKISYKLELSKGMQ